MQTRVETDQARRQLDRFLAVLGPEADRALVAVVRKVAGEGRTILKALTPRSSEPARPEGRRRLRQNVKARTRRDRESGGARAFVYYSRRGLRFQQVLAVEHGARGRPGQFAAARALEKVAGPGGDRYRGGVLSGLEAAVEVSAGKARLRRRRG